MDQEEFSSLVGEVDPAAGAAGVIAVFQHSIEALGCDDTRRAVEQVLTATRVGRVPVKPAMLVWAAGHVWPDGFDQIAAHVERVCVDAMTRCDRAEIDAAIDKDQT